MIESNSPWRVPAWMAGGGYQRYRQAGVSFQTAAGGESNGYRMRLWKVALQTLAHETGLAIRVCRFPLATRKGNPIWHRMRVFRGVQFCRKHLG
jgi:hypothetical protein